MSNLKLDKAQRQSPIGVAVIFFKNLRRAINFFLAVIVVQFGANFKMLGLNVWHWGIIVGILFLIISYLQYLKFFFYVEGGNFVIEKGVLRQEKTNVPFGRIQTVNTTQNIIQQIFGVVALSIDTAGSVAKEIEISALPRSYAERLEDYLMSRKYEELGEEQEQLEEEQEAPDKEKLKREEAAQWRKKEPLVTLNFKDLLRVGFTENHLRSGLLLFAILNGYIWQFEEYLLEPFEPYLEQTANTFLASWVLLLPIVLILFLVVSILSSMVRVLLQYFNLKFFLTPAGIFMQSGLLKRSEYRIPHRKIQYFRWSSNPLRKMIGYKTMNIKQAGGQDLGERKTVSIPGLKSRPLVNVIQTFYPERRQSKFIRFDAAFLLAQQYFFWFGVLPSLVVSAVFYFNHFMLWFYLPLIPFLVLVGYWVYQYQQSVQLRLNTAVIEIKKGWVFPSHVSMKHYKLQNVSLQQSIFQKRRNLATLTLHTAAGSEVMPHISYQAAITLYNYLLYKIESSDKGWM
jgi:putative membrane protein